jgi:hypothetical protein
VFIGPTAGTASGELPVDDDRRKASDAQALRPFRRVWMLHVVNLHFVFSTRQFLHDFDRLMTRRAAGAEDFNRAGHVRSSLSAFTLIWTPAGRHPTAQESVVARRASTSQPDASTSKPTPAYITTPESTANLPTRINSAAVMPIHIGPKPLRFRASTDRDATVTVSITAVNGSRYRSEAKNPTPNDDSSAAYPGEQTGHTIFGNIDAPIAGTPAMSVHTRLATGQLFIRHVVKTLENRAIA